MGAIRTCYHCFHTVFGDDKFCPWCGKDPFHIEIRHKPFEVEVKIDCYFTIEGCVGSVMGVG